MNQSRKPLIVGLGGTTRPGSSTEQALVLALESAQASGAETQLFGGEFLASLPHFPADGKSDSPEGDRFVDAVRRADGLVIASPGYHGSISGLVKNAIDYIEQTARDERVYLDGMPVGLIATAYGWQATASTLSTLRAIVHALRGWPTPLGACIKTTQGMFADGKCLDPAASSQLELVGRQVFQFANLHIHDPTVTETGIE